MDLFDAMQSAAVGPEVNPSMNYPGREVTPTTDRLTAEPGLNAIEWAGSTLLDADSISAFAQPGREYGTPTNDVNETIQQQHVIFPWRDNSHFLINKYEPVFVARTLDAEEGMHSNVSLTKLNNILSQADAEYKVNVKKPGTDELRFARLLGLIGEDMLECYHNLKRTFQLDLPKLGEIMAKRGFFGEDSAYTMAELEWLYEMSQKPGLRYQTKFGIKNKWNFWGVVINTNAADTQDSSYIGSLQAEGRAVTVNTAVKGTARMYNFVGSAAESLPMARVWLVLRRVTTSDGSIGPFQYVPYVSRVNECPPDTLCMYRESISDGRVRFERGDVIPLGYLAEPTTRDAPQNVRDMACGLSANVETGHAAMPSLPQVVMHLGI